MEPSASTVEATHKDGVIDKPVVRHHTGGLERQLALHIAEAGDGTKAQNQSEIRCSESSNEASLGRGTGHLSLGNGDDQPFLR